MHTVIAMIAVIIMLSTGIAWGSVRSFEGGIFHFATAALGGRNDDGAVDILLVGMDSRTDAHGNPLSEQELAALHAGDETATNTDTIILVRDSHQRSPATAISIPRDSYVEAPGLDKTKINGVYGQVKLDTMKKLVETRAWTPPRPSRRPSRQAAMRSSRPSPTSPGDRRPLRRDRLAGLSLITDALGGVEVLPQRTGLRTAFRADFPAGWQRLNGPEALSFVRQRHELPRGDLDRVVRQQVVMAALAHEVISGKTLSSPATLNRLEDAIQRSVVISAGWDVMDFLETVAAFGWRQRGLRDHSGTGRGRLERRRHAVRGARRPNQVQEWVASLLEEQDKGNTAQVAYTPDQTTADVINDSNINGLAGAVSDRLTAKGSNPAISATTTRKRSARVGYRPPRATTSAPRRSPKHSAATGSGRFVDPARHSTGGTRRTMTVRDPADGTCPRQAVRIAKR